ncbi:putative oxidoreductase GLYR1 homolog [Trichonephila clavata]|nr:putative oxidoreductase GLYR1 homolog [Trichonephila clavata]
MLQSCSEIKSALYEKAMKEIKKESLVFQKGKKKETKGEGNNIVEESGVKLSEEKIHKKDQKWYAAKIPRKVQKQCAVDQLNRENTFSIENPCVPESSFEAVDQSLSCPLSPPIKAKYNEATSKKIGFMGLGEMGQIIVKNLINTGHNVTVWNRSSMKCEKFVKAGAVQARTPADLVEKCDITFSCLSGSEAVRDVFSGTDGILSGINKFKNSNKSYVELSTLDIMTSEEIGGKIQQSGWRYLDAPLCGTKLQASSGTLLIPVSGDLEVLKDCESCFSAMANNIYYMNSVIGSATKANILINMSFSSTFAYLRESLGLMKQCGLSMRKFCEFLEDSPTSFDLESGSHLRFLKEFFYSEPKHQEKILDLALSAANSCDESLFLTKALREYMKKAKLFASPNPDMSVHLGTK